MIDRDVALLLIGAVIALVGWVLKKLTQDQPKLGSTLSAIGGVLGVLVGSFGGTLIAVPEIFGELALCFVIYMAEALFLGPIVGILGGKLAAAFAGADTETGTLAWAFGGGLAGLLAGLVTTLPLCLLSGLRAAL